MKFVKEITLDMAGNMELASKIFFPESQLVTDRFTHMFYLNFGIRDTASLNSRCEIDNGSLATCKDKVLMGRN